MLDRAWLSSEKTCSRPWRYLAPTLLRVGQLRALPYLNGCVGVVACKNGSSGAVCPSSDEAHGLSRARRSGEAKGARRRGADWEPNLLVRDHGWNWFVHEAR